MTDVSLSPAEALGRVHGILERAVNADRSVVLEIFRMALHRPKHAFEVLARVSDPARLRQSDHDEIQALMSQVGDIPDELPAGEVHGYVLGHGDAIRARICDPASPSAPGPSTRGGSSPPAPSLWRSAQGGRPPAGSASPLRAAAVSGPFAALRGRG
jgi:hypothetical protein